jgi:hypothetical protein
MGRLGDPLNTFWELFHVAPGGAWTLATPPGVASNGGLFLALGTEAAVTVAFGPSLGLRFTPLARTASAAATWTTGILPGAITRVPDAMAVSGPGSLWALMGPGGTRLVASRDLVTWSGEGTLRSFGGAAPPGCRFQAATAVDPAAAGGVAVGGVCSSGPQAGILLRSGTTWRLAGPVVKGGASTSSEVLRLVPSGQGVAALIRTGSGSTSELVAAYGSAEFGAWHVGNALTIAGDTLISSSSIASGGIVVLLERSDGSRVAEVSAPGKPAWVSLPVLAAGTAIVAPLPGGGFDALIPRASTLIVERLASSGWVRSQALVVPIQIGSSH